MKNFEEIENAAFNNYDDSQDSYDLENYDDNASNYNPNVARPGQPKQVISASFDLSMANPTAVPITFEIFNLLNSFLKKLNTSYVSGTYTYIPQLTLEGISAAGLGVVGFTKDGILKITSSDVLTLAAATLTCQQFPYSGLLESSGAEPFYIKRIRQKSVTDAQIDNQIIHFRSSFLGSTAQNTVTPRQFFRPTQFQNTIVDIPVNWLIDSKRGLQYLVNPGETVTWNITLTRKK